MHKKQQVHLPIVARMWGRSSGQLIDSRRDRLPHSIPVSQFHRIRGDRYADSSKLSKTVIIDCWLHLWRKSWPVLTVFIHLSDQFEIKMQARHHESSYIELKKLDLRNALIMPMIEIEREVRLAFIKDNVQMFPWMIRCHQVVL